MRAERGVALVLVLMISGTLGLLMLQFGLTAREQTARAQKLVERAQADLRLRSINTQVLFALTTNSWDLRRQQESEDPFVAGMNFRGEPFSVGDATVAVQDLSGLVAFPQPGVGGARLDSVLAASGVPEERARSIAERIIRMPPPPKGAPLQDFYELTLIAGLARGEADKLPAIATLYPTRGFNPVTAPDRALRAMFSGSVLQGLEARRESGSLDAQGFFSVTGVGLEDSTVFFPGPGFEIRTRVSFGSATAAEERSLTIDPYGRYPISVWSRRRPLAESLDR